MVGPKNGGRPARDKNPPLGWEVTHGSHRSTRLLCSSSLDAEQNPGSSLMRASPSREESVYALSK
uniref:Uncharacterized protein n=1 Tax=Anopheles quadriannulatus TaxID=34691 RepID=A0A182XQR3_ANOQN